MQVATAKKLRHKRTRLVMPRIGIFYLLGEKLLIDSSPLAEASDLDDLAFHELEHEHWWALLVNGGDTPNAGYTEFPRGRVSFGRRRGRFALLADRCILENKSVVKAILSGFHLPPRRTKIATDGCYRCAVCMRSKP